MTIGNTEQNQCPLNSLPPRLKRAINEAICLTQAPPGLVVASALAAASLAVQAKYDVRRFSGLASPCSLFFITIAESGERKTTVDRLFFDGIAKFEDDFEFRSDHFDETDSQANPRLLYSDTTPMAFMKNMSENSVSAILREDEAGRIFTGRLIEDLGLINKLWDGRTISVDRVRQSFKIESPRLSISWMVQPSVFAKYMSKKGDDARGIGTLARSLVSFPKSTQGTRFIRSVPEKMEGIEAFGQRIIELLNDQLEYIFPSRGRQIERELLYFDPMAQANFDMVFNQIEAAIRPGGEFCQHRDYASKVAENIARMAGVMHVFEGCSGNSISSETLGSATDLVAWYAREFIRLFSPPGPADVIRYYASLLDEWLLNCYREIGVVDISKNVVLQLGPNQLRKAEVLNIALQRLVDAGRVIVVSQLSHPLSRKGTAKIRPVYGYYGSILGGFTPIGFSGL